MTRQRPIDGNPEPRDSNTRWSTMATAPDQTVAEMWQEILSEESIPSMLAPQDAISFLGVTPTPVRLMVPSELVARAREVLARFLADAEERSSSADTAE